MESPWDKTIDVWLWHLDTVEKVKQIINDEQTIPKDAQRVFLPGTGILDNEIRVGRLYTSPTTPPRLFLLKFLEDKAAEVLEES